MMVPMMMDDPPNNPSDRNITGFWSSISIVGL
jgi:hypothetical protein